MPNGKALQKLKDNLDEKGCYYGKFNREYIDTTKKDINKIGGKLGKMIWLLIVTLTGLVINLIVLYLKGG